jgi:hypothetical protein
MSADDDATAALVAMEARLWEAVDEEARVTEHLTDAELHDRRVIEEATFWQGVVNPDDPETREHLITAEGMDPALADEVLARMRLAVAGRSRRRAATTEGERGAVGG